MNIKIYFDKDVNIDLIDTIVNKNVKKLNIRRKKGSDII